MKRKGREVIEERKRFFAWERKEEKKAIKEKKDLIGERESAEAENFKVTVLVRHGLELKEKKR